MPLVEIAHSTVYIHQKARISSHFTDVLVFSFHQLNNQQSTTKLPEDATIRYLGRCRLIQIRPRNVHLYSAEIKWDGVPGDPPPLSWVPAHVSLSLTSSAVLRVTTGFRYLEAQDQRRPVHHSNHEAPDVA